MTIVFVGAQTTSDQSVWIVNDIDRSLLEEIAAKEDNYEAQFNQIIVRITREHLV